MEANFAPVVRRAFWRTARRTAPALFTAVLSVVSAGQTITEETKLVAPDGDSWDEFGYVVSISGNRAVVSAHEDDDLGYDSGAVYVFELGPGGWGLPVKLTASDGSAGEDFGDSVSISGNRVIVASQYNNASGAAYVFELGPGGWFEHPKLTASDGAAGDLFGGSVSIDGDIAIVGAGWDDDLGPSSGSAYAFEFGPTGWVETAKLTKPNGQAQDLFGWSVAVSGNQALVCDGFGSVYVYERDPNGWQYQTQLVPSQGWTSGSMSISGDRAILGAIPYSAVVFELGPGGWAEQARFVAPDSSTSRFGKAVAISGDRALVGAGNGSHDKVYAYEFGPSGWVEQAVLVPLEQPYDFAGSVSISGDNAIAGAPFANGLVADSGAAYVFDVTSATCTSRNGILGLNPPDFVCASVPKIGATWISRIATTPLVGQSTSLTAVAIGRGGPTEGVVAFGYELLALPTFLPLLVSATGAHALAVPSFPTLAGKTFSAQGLRLEATGGTSHLVLTNALDLVLGH